MKYVKMVLISFVVFFGMFTLIGLLFPPVSKSVSGVVINNEKGIVVEELLHKTNWIKWHPFFHPDIGGQVDIKTADSTIFSNDKNEMLLIASKADSNTVSFDTEYGHGRITKNYIQVLDITDDSTSVQIIWTEMEKLKWYPWERFRGLVLEKAKTEYINAVLNNFKQYMDTLNVR